MSIGSARLTLIVYMVSAAVTTLPALAKHTAHPFVLLSLYTAALGCALVVVRRLTTIIDAHPRVAMTLWTVPCLLLAFASARLYPSTRMTMARSSAPDALIEPAVRLIHGTHPYMGLLFDGAPISPGPGWIVAHAPLTVSGLVWLVVPLHLAFAAWIMSRYRPSAGVWLVGLVVLLPAFLQMSFVGHDLFGIGCAMLATTIGLHGCSDSSTGRLLLWGIAAGIVATARVPLLVYVAALALLLWRRESRLGVRFAVIAGATAITCHVAAWYSVQLAGGWYQPLHVFGRAGRAGNLVGPIGFALSLAASVWLWRRGTEPLADWLRFVWSIAGLPFVAVGIAELVGPSAWQWSSWEGKVYVGFALPLLIGAMLFDAARPDLQVPNRGWDRDQVHAD